MENFIYKLKNRYYNSDMTQHKLFGFTLAETLITIGIIGVVAALTIPTLLANYRKHVVETRLEKFYSEINQAIKMSEIENGDILQWDSWRNIYDNPKKPTYEENLRYMQKYIIPYIKTLSIEPCKTKTSSVCITLTNGSMFSFDSDDLTFYPNKKLENEPKEQYLGKNCFEFILAPNDIHYTNANSKGIEPYVGSWNGNYNVLFSHYVYACTSSKNVCSSNNNRYCTKIIQMNGWKIPKEYPIKF